MKKYTLNKKWVLLLAIVSLGIGTLFLVDYLTPPKQIVRDLPWVESTNTSTSTTSPEIHPIDAFIKATLPTSNRTDDLVAIPELDIVFFQATDPRASTCELSAEYCKSVGVRLGEKIGWIKVQDNISVVVKSKYSFNADDATLYSAEVVNALKAANADWYNHIYAPVIASESTGAPIDTLAMLIQDLQDAFFSQTAYELLANEMLTSNQSLLEAFYEIAVEQQDLNLLQRTEYFLDRLRYTAATGKQATYSENVITFGTDLYKISSTWDSTITKQTLTKIDGENGEETIMIENLLSMAHAPEDTERFPFRFFFTPKDSSQIVLRTFVPDTDNPFSQLYLYDTVENSVRELIVINQSFNNFFGELTLSPSKQKGIWITTGPDQEEARTMLVLDFVNDTVTNVINLSESETFKNDIGLASIETEVKWADEDLIRYTIYSTTTPLKERPTNPLGEREVRL